MEAQIFDFTEIPTTTRTGGGARQSEELRLLRSLNVGQAVRFSLDEHGNEGETFEQFSRRISPKAYNAGTDPSGEPYNFTVRNDPVNSTVTCYRQPAQQEAEAN